VNGLHAVGLMEYNVDTNSMTFTNGEVAFMAMVWIHVPVSSIYSSDVKRDD
jgi:hypothetical protein